MKDTILPKTGEERAFASQWMNLQINIRGEMPIISTHPIMDGALSNIILIQNAFHFWKGFKTTRQREKKSLISWMYFIGEWQTFDENET